jgi:hypothetical protein
MVRRLESRADSQIRLCLDRKPTVQQEDPTSIQTGSYDATFQVLNCPNRASFCTARTV